jgi:hypothetical protein
MAVTPTSRSLARVLVAALVTVVAAALVPAAAGAATTSKASVTNATTGMPDASSLVPRSACAVPKPGHAGCLAQFLAVRQTGAPVHPRLQAAYSPNRLRRVRARSGAAAPAAALAAATSPVPAPQPGAPAYLQQAYDLAALAQTAGGNQTIAIVDAYDNPKAESDLATYRSTFGLPACTTANGCFQKVNEYGNATPLPGSPSAAESGWLTEISLDLQAVSAICPNCKIQLVEAFTSGIDHLAQAQYGAAHLTPKPTVISDSWGAVPAGSANQQAADQEQQWLQHTGRFTFPGIATVAASGDSGYLGSPQNQACKSNSQASCNVYPAALPGVTSAGGTTMVPANGGGVQAARGLSESAWSGTGSGCDTTESKPSWQTYTGCAGRSYNDLSAVADPQTGMDVYSQSAGGWEIVGGTSLASPLLAAYYALVGAGTDPSWAYNSALQSPHIFNDPTSGSNGTCAGISYICTAMAGYDGPTGLGTMSGAIVPGAPGIGAPGFGDIGFNDSSYTKSVTPNSSQLQGGVYPNGNETTYWWQYGTTTSYGQTTRPTGIGSGTAPVPVTDTLTGLVPGATYHYRLVAQSPDPANPGSFLTQFGYDFTLTTSSASSAASGPGAGSGSNGTTTTTTSPTPTSTPIASGTTPTGTTPPTGTHTPGAPSLGSLRVLSLGSGSATVTELINTSGAATRYYLAYGTKPKLSQRTATASSTRSRMVTWHLRGLRAGKIYYLQAVAANGGGARRSAAVAVKTSAVSVGSVTAHANTLTVALRCRGSAGCRVRLTVKIGKQTVASGNATVRGNHSATVTLKLNRAAATRASHGKKAQATLSAISVWNGYPATVSARFRIALR